MEKALMALKEAVVSLQLVMTSPATRFRPTLTIEGGEFVASYGPVKGRGFSPDDAITSFNYNWFNTSVRRIQEEEKRV